MKWWKIEPWGLFTTANEIQAEAMLHGYQPYRDSKTGQTHPGRDCNAELRKVMADPGLMKRYGIQPEHVLSVKKEESDENARFIDMLKEQGLVHHSALKNKEGLQLYSDKAAEAIFGMWLNDTTIIVQVSEEDEVYPKTYRLSPAAKNLAKGKDQKKNRLFGHSRKL